METISARQLGEHLTELLEEPGFLKKLSIPRLEANALFWSADWETYLRPLLPIRRRLTCKEVTDALHPLLEKFAPEPPEGWLRWCFQVANILPYTRVCKEYHTPRQWDAALCALKILQCLLDLERDTLPFSPTQDFAFCTPEELSASKSANTKEYERFLHRFREEHLYELMRLGQEATPFRTLEHIAGVHHVAMTAGRAFAAGGGKVDLPLLSAAAAAHDLGKYGCRPGERVPYLHYYYTDQWCRIRNLPNVGRIAANHSVWDLEIENLSSESLLLVYADFRVKQERNERGEEITKIYTLAEAFDVILSKLDNVDDAKRRRYQFVYSKLRDFEDYLITFGVDTTLKQPRLPPVVKQDSALLNSDDVVRRLRWFAVDHNIRLMHRLGHERLFTSILEAARSEKRANRIQASVSVFEEYFTYWSIEQKEETLQFLYELLLNPDGDLRRQAAALMGRILAGFHSGYRKEKPVDSSPDPILTRHYELWELYLEKLIQPDNRLTVQQISRIRYAAKLVVDALLEHASQTDAAVFAEILFRRFRAPAETAPDAAFALLDTIVNLPAACCQPEDTASLVNFAIYWLKAGGSLQKAAAMRLFRHLLEPQFQLDGMLIGKIANAVEDTDCRNNTPLMFLQSQLGRQLGFVLESQDEFLSRQTTVSNIFLDNLKTATPWVLKAVGVEYLQDQVEHGSRANVLHIATHFSNLMKVSENVVVRQMAGAALLALAPILTQDRRNEIVVELSKSLEADQSKLSQCIPEYLGRFTLWLHPKELDEIIGQMESLLTFAASSAAVAALGTISSMLEYYSEYGSRFYESKEQLAARRNRLAGLILKGLASDRSEIQQEAYRVLGEKLFASDHMSYEEKTSLFVLLAKKLLCLISENEGLTFFYTAAALSHVYRFIVEHRIQDGPFVFQIPDKVAFFPGTFDPFSLSHKGIVRAILDMGFEVYLAIDEFSWSKKAQPNLIRRRIASMAVADAFHVYLFPHDIPVNLSNTENLNRLRELFAGRELYLAVGEDVIANASSYQMEPTPGCVLEMNHIFFQRAGQIADTSRIRGKVVELQLPAHLEDISSTRIREDIDLGRDISHLVDPAVQEYINRNSLYLREPRYKRMLRVNYLDFQLEKHPDDHLRNLLLESVSSRRISHIDARDSIMYLRNLDEGGKIQGFITLRIINSAGLYDALQDTDLANQVRERSMGRTLLLTGLYLSRQITNSVSIGQLLLTEALTWGVHQDCSCAICCPRVHQWKEWHIELLHRQGFLPLNGSDRLLLTDMRAPVVLIQNIPTTLKEPFASSPKILSAVETAQRRMQDAICNLYPGNLVLALNAEVIYHRLVRKVIHRNRVPEKPVEPRTLGKLMCVPFGKILRGNAIPNTVTKTIHTDKVFAPDLKSFHIEAFPGYTPLESQISVVKSFQRPVILVDDMLHTGDRLKALIPMLRKAEVPIDRVVVGLMSGRGRDLMRSKNMKADCVYFVSNLKELFLESTMYPFIGGDAVKGVRPSVPGLTPAVNLVLPYAFPSFYKSCDRAAVFRFSQVCLENSRNIMEAIEQEYRRRYARNLTLSHLSEAVILPLSPDKGNSVLYNPNLSASACLQNDLQMLLRIQDLLEWEEP